MTYDLTTITISILMILLIIFAGGLALALHKIAELEEDIAESIVHIYRPCKECPDAKR